MCWMCCLTEGKGGKGKGIFSGMYVDQQISMVSDSTGCLLMSNSCCESVYTTMQGGQDVFNR